MIPLLQNIKLINDLITHSDLNEVDHPIDSDHPPNECKSTKPHYSLRKRVKSPQRYLD